MAKQVLTTFVDDLNDEITEDVKTVEFGLYGKNYTIDLGKENREILEQNLADFIEVAKKASRGGGRPQVKQQVSNGRSPAVDREQNQAIREWARKRGLNVKDRGRIPAGVVEAYHQEA